MEFDPGVGELLAVTPQPMVSLDGGVSCIGSGVNTSQAAVAGSGGNQDEPVSSTAVPDPFDDDGEG